MTITETQLNEFLERAQRQVDASYDEFLPKPRMINGPILSIEAGRRYARIVATNDDGRGRRVWGFIDMTNGDVMKAASWKTPAKNFARGNIADELGGLGRTSWTGVY